MLDLNAPTEPDEPDPPEEPDGPEEPPRPFDAFGPAFEEPDQTPMPVEASPEEPPAPAEQSLERRHQSFLATVLAHKVFDGPTYTQAWEYAKTLAGFIKDARAHWDERVALSYARWKKDCDDRNAALDPLELGKVTIETRARDWKREQDEKAAREKKRLQDEADRKALAEKQAKEAEARKAREEGDRARAAELVQEARAIEAPIVEVKSTVPTAPKGVTPDKANWTFAVDNCPALVLAIARPHIYRELLAELKAKGAEKGTGAEVIAFIDFLEGQAIDIPFGAVEQNDVYLRQRAKADRDTLQWPGVRFYDKGSSAVKVA